MFIAITGETATESMPVTEHISNILSEGDW